MNFPRGTVLIITAAGVAITFTATLFPASLSPVTEIAAVLASYLVPATVMLALYAVVMEMTGSPWYWWGKKQAGTGQPSGGSAGGFYAGTAAAVPGDRRSFPDEHSRSDPARSMLVPEANRYLALWCLTVECGGIAVLAALFIPLFTNPVVLLPAMGIFFSILMWIDGRFRDVADRIDPSFLDIWTGARTNIFMATYFLAFVCMMFVAVAIPFVFSPFIAHGFPSSPVPAVLAFRYYFLTLPLLSAPGFVWLTIRLRD